MLRREPGNRYECAGALAEDLGRFLLHKPIKARPRGAAERALRWVRRNWTLTASAVAVAVSLAVFAAREATLRARSQEALASLTGPLGDLEPVGLKGSPFGPEVQTGLGPADSETLDRYVRIVRNETLTDRPDIRASLLS
jgi:hypothetical protein